MSGQQEPADDFPDINLDVIRERTASMRPGRHSLADREGAQEIGLPPEPTGEVVVEAVNDTGGMAYAWMPVGGGWVRVGTILIKGEPVGVDPAPWSAVVGTALASGWKLYVRAAGVESGAES